MKKYISHAWYAGGVKEFDTETGAVLNAPNIAWGETDFGSVWKQNGKWFVFHKDNESLILQYKNNIWRVTSEYTVSLRGYFIFRNFRIMRNGKLVFSIWYKPKYLFGGLVDPTYDGLDAQSDDFFLYVKNIWHDWAARPFPDFDKDYKEKNV